MNYTERAKQLGFSAAAVMDTKNLVFKPEYRVFCEENRCGNYDRNPACPPESGSVEEMKKEGKSDLLIMTAGPYRHHSCMSAYCVDAQEMADATGMTCWGKDGKVRYFSQVLFHDTGK